MSETRSRLFLGRNNHTHMESERAICGHTRECGSILQNLISKFPKVLNAVYFAITVMYMQMFSVWANPAFYWYNMLPFVSFILCIIYEAPLLNIIYLNYLHKFYADWVDKYQIWRFQNLANFSKLHDKFFFLCHSRSPYGTNFPPTQTG